MDQMAFPKNIIVEKLVLTYPTSYNCTVLINGDFSLTFVHNLTEIMRASLVIRKHLNHLLVH